MKTTSSPLQRLPEPRRPLIWLAVLLFASKALQFAVDSRPLLFSDSASFVKNALRVCFRPERSYVYGWLIRGCCIPLSSLVPLVALQVLASGVVAWLLAFVLIRFLRVRREIAVTAALAFAWDPTQVISEHLVMTETAAGLVAAFFLGAALAYLATPRIFWLPVLALLGTVLVGLRLVYVPMVYAAAVLIPLMAVRALKRDSRRRLVIALCLSVMAVTAGQVGYLRLTGWLAMREPAYQYRTGLFLVGALAPLLREEDTADPRVAAAVREQPQSGHPLEDPSADARNFQLWAPGGLVSRLTGAFDGDRVRASEEARSLALHAVRRDPVGFLVLGFRGWSDYPELLGQKKFRWVLRVEHGSDPAVQPSEANWRIVTAHFPRQRRDQAIESTPSRRYHMLSLPWCWMQYLAPFLGLAATCVAPQGTRRAAGFLALWSGLLLATTCLTTPIAVRYLHPLSFTGLAALALLAERLFRRAGVEGQQQKASLT